MRLLTKRCTVLTVLLSCFMLTLKAQSFVCEGQVHGADDKLPLPGVSVAVKGGQNGTSTNEEGYFSLEVMPGDILVFTFLGFKTVEREAAGEKMEVFLESDFARLDEVVVTGYQTQRKADLTGAVSVVDMEDIRDQASGNVMKSLQGRVPGVYISTNGSPDGGASVLIRGIGTLGNNSPLYIIDGMPSTKSMNEISALDIESVQVLKDASAASIYGSRAANGVIIVTTEKGQKGETKVEARVAAGLRNYAKSLDWLTTEERGFVQWQAARNDGIDPNFGVYTFQDHQDASGNWILDEVVLPEFIDDAQTMRAANTDWVEEVGRNSVVQNYNVTLSTGSEKSRALFALDYFDSKGTVKGTYFDRLSGRINSDFSLLGDRLTIGENFSLTHTDRDALGSVLGSTRNIQPIVPVHTEDGGWGGPVAGMSDRQNPVRLIADNRQNRNNMLRLFGDMFLNLEVIKNLNFRSMLGMDYSFSWERNMQRSYHSGFLSEPVASLNNYSNRWGNWVWNNTLTYDFELNDVHDFEVLAGQEMLKYYSESLQAGRRGFTSEDPDYMYLNAGEETQTNSGSGTAYSLLSYFGKINYVFRDKYLASVTTRYDGSSRFGGNNKFGVFPAFSVGWRISEEPFFQKAFPFISQLKLRYGWGQTGNQDIGDFASYGLYEAKYGTDPTFNPDDGTAYDISGNGSGALPSGYRRVQQSNPDLKWETATQSNFGLDFGFLNERFSGSIDYFIKQTEDILILPPYIATLGEGGNRWVNGASMENKGLEFLLAYNNSISSDLWFSITGNIAGYRNKVVKLPEEVINSYAGNGNDQTILGRALNSMFGYVADGLFRTPEELEQHAEQVGKDLGRIRYKDLDGSGEIGDEDRTWLGVTDPDFVYGINFSVHYRQWDFGMFWNGISGGKVNNSTKGFTDFISFFGGENYGKRVLNAWTPLNADSDIPALSFNDTNNEKRFSTYFIESSSYLKLRTLEIGYRLPAALNSRLRLQNARLFLLGENLLTFMKTHGADRYTGVDPEAPGSAYPIPFSATFGMNVTF